MGEVPPVVPELGGGSVWRGAVNRPGRAGPRARRWIWPRLRLAQRIVLGVGASVGVALGLLYLTAVATVNGAVGAAGQEQVVLAVVERLGVGAALCFVLALGAAWIGVQLDRRVAERTREIERLYGTLQQRESERALLLGQIIDAQEEERRRIAGELHDEISQALTSILIQVELLFQSDQLSPITQQRLADVRALTTSTLDNVHSLAAELRPSLLDDIGLVAALRRLVDEYHERHGCNLDFQTVGLDGLRLLPPVETALFRITQAALSNVARHAEATIVSVLLQRRGGSLILVIEDDGRGFDLASVRAAPLKDRLGLAGIEERAQLIGARTTIESRPDEGTTIHVEVPLGGNLASEKSDDPAACLAGR